MRPPAERRIQGVTVIPGAGGTVPGGKQVPLQPGSCPVGDPLKRLRSRTEWTTVWMTATTNPGCCCSPPWSLCVAKIESELAERTERAAC
jgi:hypothetical protein